MVGRKKEASKKEIFEETISIDDPINTKDWKCVVVMAIERTFYDTFVLKEFMEEASNGRRQEVNLISYEHFILKLLNDFSNGQLPYKYAFLLKFSEIFQEAAEFAKNKMTIPVNLLAKIVKALLFYYREDSIKKIEKKKMGPQDPVKVMAERPFHSGGYFQTRGHVSNAAKKDLSPGPKGKNRIIDQNGPIKIKPPSTTKEETKLLKRGEGAKETQCIDDAPLDGFFNMYVLLIGFYCPDFPVELVKAQIPLHGFLCIDATLSGIKRTTSFTYGRIQKKNSQTKSSELKYFWDEFLNILWNPKFIIYFKEVIFQVYTPQKFSCEKKKLRELIYKEISYLMYDISDYKRLHIDYLNNLKLWNVEHDAKEILKPKITTDSKECATVPLVLWHILNEICGKNDNNFKYSKNWSKNGSFEKLDSETIENNLSEHSVLTQSLMANRSLSVESFRWRDIVLRSGNRNITRIHSKVNNLDIEYLLNASDFKPFLGYSEIKDVEKSNTSCCHHSKRVPTENIDEAMCFGYGFSRSHWKKIKCNINAKTQSFSAAFDYCLYLLFMSKINCLYELSDLPSQAELSVEPLRVSEFLKKNSNFAIIDNLEEEMRRPHFSVTEGSRTVLRRIPYNVKKINQNFFCPKELKLITPEKVKSISTPNFCHPADGALNKVTFISELNIPEQIINKIEWNVYKNIHDFLGNYLLPDSNEFDFVEELSKTKLLTKEQHILDDFNCIDCNYSVLTDSLLLIIHNKKDEKNSFHEAFNIRLKNKIGLRDFFDYVLEDESQWFASRETVRKNKLFSVGKGTVDSESLNGYVDSDFWLKNSIKYLEYSEKKNGWNLNIKKEPDETEKLEKSFLNFESASKGSFSCRNVDRELTHEFEGYDLEELAIQFSGLKTMHFSNDCSITSELVERLYGKQELGIHVRQSGHALHLYSYVCPEPHVLDPFTFHLTYKNGIIAAFGKRTINKKKKKVFSQESIEPSSTSFKNKKNSSETKPPKDSATIVDFVEDNEFAYDFKLSFPNGLTLEIIPDAIKPCYVKQKHLNNRCEAISEGTIGDENCRLFLPDGSLVKMMKDNTFRVLKANGSVLTASVKNVVDETSLRLSKYEMITSEGNVISVEGDRIISTKSLEMFQFSELESDRKYFRRADGTNYIIESGGRLCVEFSDGTKMSSTPIWGEEIILEEKSLVANCENEEKESTIFEMNFVLIYEEIVVEHPNFATITYNSFTKQWKIILPFGSTINVNHVGEYFVDIDKESKIEITKDVIEMKKFSSNRNLTCATTVYITVFDKDSSGIYCKMEDFSSGETYVVEANGNNYLLPGKENNQQAKSVDRIEENRLEVKSTEYIASNAPFCEQNEEKAKTLENNVKKNKKVFSKDKKYLVVRKDLSGFEMIHRTDFEKALIERNEESLLHIREFNGLRCFVLLSPSRKSKDLCEMWRMDSMLPNPKWDAENKPKQTSSTYGVPPSWIHPFPKKKIPFFVPRFLTCRVFAEIKKTNFVSGKDRLEFQFCDLPEPEVLSSLENLNINTVQDYANLFLNEDQAFLKNAYLKAAKEISGGEKNKKIFNSEKFKGALAALKNEIELQEELKTALRFRLVPNYFHHAEGMCWLILDSLLRDGKFGSGRKTAEFSSSALVTPKSQKSNSTFSNEEIEYDLKWSPAKSFSELSCLTNASWKTAPAVLRQGNRQCRVEVTRNAASAPAIKLFDDDRSDDDSNVTKEGICFLDDDKTEMEENLRALKGVEVFEDLQRLGLI